MDNNTYKIPGNNTDAGIYKITCCVNKRIYIGSSINIKIRIRAHINSLRKNKHINKSLQNSYNKHGEWEFIYECIEAVNKDINTEELLKIEQRYLDKLTPWDETIGFNLCKIASKPPCRKGAVFTEEHKKKISAARKGKKHPHSYSTLVTLIHKTGIIDSKTQHEWRQLKVDACSLIHNRQKTSKDWMLQS
jgi:group I intron endonuclease